jgi:REP element-mobilizing transposase RayT
LPSLRSQPERAALGRAFALGRDRFGFRLVHHSIPSNHLHLIVEARDRRALSRGMKGLLVRGARALNELWSRRGSAFADRFRARSLRRPREVRNALAYELQNARRHGIHGHGRDEYSSGPWLDGWKEHVVAPGRARPAAEATTWLLRTGWRRHGLIGLAEAPSAPQGSVAAAARPRAQLPRLSTSRAITMRWISLVPS